jgi:6-phosphogluconolactonase
MNGGEARLFIASGNGQGDAPGISLVALDTASGEMRMVEQTTAISGCHYLNLSPDGRFLYATSIDRSAPKGLSSTVHAFAVDPGSGKLSEMNRLPAGGDSPCYISTDPQRRYLLMVNYTGLDDLGSVRVFAIEDDGSIGQQLSHIEHEGGSVHSTRQRSSHPHMIRTNPAGTVVLVPDLGIDRVMLYDLNQGMLAPHKPASLRLAAGAGPRHVAIHPLGRYLYVINELNSTVTVYDWEAPQDALQVISALPDGYAEDSYCADIHCAPAGNFVYGSNRGHNSIVAYRVDQTSGRLSLLGHTPTGGDWPRAFELLPSGDMLIAANQNSGTLCSFYVDTSSGALTPTGHCLDIAEPVAVKTWHT